MRKLEGRVHTKMQEVLRFENIFKHCKLECFKVK